MSPPLKIRSLFADIPSTLADEKFEVWLERPGFRLERILSREHSTPEGSWYDQEQDEWVALLQGRAQLLIEGQPELIDLLPGDTLLIPAHCRHRVLWTDSTQTTIWLAAHFQPGSSEDGTQTEKHTLEESHENPSAATTQAWIA